MPIVDDIDLFESQGGAAHARAIYESDDPSFFFVLTDGDQPLGRIGVIAEESCPANLRGGLPDREYRLFCSVLPPLESAPRFIHEVLSALPSSISPYADIVLNPEFHGAVDTDRSVCEQAGMELFQEKHGYHWDDPGSPVEVPDRLTFVDIDAVGEREYAAIIGRAGEGTLDRNDQWYRDHTGPENWGKVFLSYLTDEHRDSWLVGHDTAGDTVGFIAVSDIGGGEPTE